MLRIVQIICFSALALCSGCNSSLKDTGDIKRAFPRTEIPAMISSKEEILKYKVKHYWDRFLDSVRLARTEQLRSEIKGSPTDSLILGIGSAEFEAAFGEYSYLVNYLQPTDYHTVRTSLKKLFERADGIAYSGDSSFLFRLMDLCEKYFYNPNSPVLNEEAYIPALEGILSARSVDELSKMQYEYQLKISSLNRIGSLAADFDYSTVKEASGGNRIKGSLYSIKADYTLIFFNNPDCFSCADIKEMLKTNPAVKSLTGNGRMKILVMYTDDQLDTWSKNRKSYPDKWIYAYDHNFILRENNIYGLRAIPSLYLLDRDKEVLLKDAKAEKVIEFLQQVK